MPRQFIHLVRVHVCLVVCVSNCTAVVSWLASVAGVAATVLTATWFSITAHIVTHYCVLTLQLLLLLLSLLCAHTTTELRRPPRTAIECPQFDALERPDPTKFDGHHWEHIVRSYIYCYC
jgi:hypothetical protein